MTNLEKTSVTRHEVQTGQIVAGAMQVRPCELILAAARNELEEVGIVGFRIRSVAKRASVAPATIYRHFPGRDALLAEAILAAQDEQIAFARLVTADVSTADGAAAAVTVWMTSAFNAGSHESRWRMAEYISHEDGSEKPSQFPLVDATVTMLERVATKRPLRPGITSVGLARFIVASYFGLLIFSGDESVDDESASDFGLAIGELVRRAFKGHDEQNVRDSQTYEALGLEWVGRRPPAGASRRQQIAAHAAEIFREKGGGAFEVSDVAERVGIPASGVYRYFATKGDLIGEAAVMSFDDIRTNWTRTMNLVAELFATSNRKEIPSLVGSFGENGNAPSVREVRIETIRSLVFARASEESTARFQRLVHLAVDESIETFGALATRGFLSSRVSPTAASFLILSPMLGRAMFDHGAIHDLPQGEWGRYFEILIDEVVLAPASGTEPDQL